MHVRKGDNVVVIAGNDKGTKGDVTRVFPKENRVIVSGVNLRWKHKRPTQREPKGERVQEERPIHASNVMRIDPSSGKGTRKNRKTEA